MQTIETDQGPGVDGPEAREHRLVELVLLATECTEDEWEVADLMGDWIQTDPLLESPTFQIQQAAGARELPHGAPTHDWAEHDWAEPIPLQPKAD